MFKKRNCLRDSNWKVTRDSPCVVWHTFLLHQYPVPERCAGLDTASAYLSQGGEPSHWRFGASIRTHQPPNSHSICSLSIFLSTGPNTKAASLLSKMWCQNQVTSRYLDDKTEHLFCAMIGLLQGLFHLVSF